MDRPTVLRFAICACTPRYHGKFSGRVLRIGNRHFSLREVRVSEGNHDAELKTQRCHFFIDVHRGYFDYPWHVFIEMNDFDARPGNFWNGFVLRGEFLVSASIHWYMKRPQSVPTLICGLRQLLLSFTSGDLSRWLRRMSLPRPASSAKPPRLGTLAGSP